MEIFTNLFFIKTTAMTNTQFILLSYFICNISCNNTARATEPEPEKRSPEPQPTSIGKIPLPNGFHYLNTGDTLYAKWLREIKLKSSNVVYLYDGNTKSYQGAQFAVLDLGIGKKDLIQCADAAMKLRADYLFSRERFSEIKFTATSGDEVSFERWIGGTRWKEQRGKLVAYTNSGRPGASEASYQSFMEMVYSYCGTYSLAKQLTNVTSIRRIEPGDVFVEGGFPGHAVTVMAVAKNDAGKIIFLLSQGYMPAQDIHLLKNFGNNELSPWYDVDDLYPLYTPQWQFANGSLRKW